ncbi:MAG: response regulator [Thermoanaerobaculia bacterium]|nr:response regulator [Thermoanaerobaculia bacterium]
MKGAEELKDIEILIVEDNEHDLELTMRALKKHKISNRVLALRDGEEAIDYLFRRGEFEERDDSKPKVIFLDLKLPKIDGLEVLERIKEDPETRGIPVVMLTSSAEETDRLRSYDLGVNSYVVKPVDFDDFMLAISRAGYYWIALNRPPADERKKTGTV